MISIDLISVLHAEIFGDEAPISNTSWLSDVFKVQQTASRIWPDRMIADVFCEIASWLYGIGQFEQSRLLWNFIYTNRHAICAKKFDIISNR